MTRRCVEAADVGRVAVDAGKRAVLINRGQFVVEILAQAVLVVTFGAGGDWDVGFQAAQRG